MSEHLIREELLRVDKSLLRQTSEFAVAAIDRGSTLTKILYSTDVHEQHSQLHFALFRNRHFDAALDFLKGKLETDVAKKLRVTGVGANLHGDKIKEKLGVETEFIDEAVCQFVGFHFLVKNFPLRDICHPLPTFDHAELDKIQRAATFQKVREAQAAMLSEQPTDGKFPCLFAICGSSAGVVLVKADGSIEVKHRHLLAGKSLLGVCKLLVGTSDYAEIMTMASIGKRGNIDTQVKDILADAPNSPYGRMPPSLPFFTFGKAVDFDKSLEDTKPEDVAQSLVSSFIVNFVNMVTFIATSEKVCNVFYGGNFFQHEFAMIEVLKFGKLFGTADVMNVQFLKTGHTAALGAILSSKQDVSDFFAAMKVNNG